MIRFNTPSVALSIALGIAFASGAAFAAGPKTISKCEVLDEPGTYTVDANILADASPCIEIAADGVVVDLDGFTINGDVASTVIGFATGSPQNNTVVRNGTVRGSTLVAVLVGGTSVVENLRVLGPAGAGVAISAGQGSIIRGNIAESNTIAITIDCPAVVSHNAAFGLQGAIVEGNDDADLCAELANTSPVENFSDTLP